jgi:SAM-dependent methyltransferase
MSYLLIHGDARRLPLANHSVDAIICDPPYAEIDRDYGRLTEHKWHELMRGVIRESRRVLKPHGSAVFVLQANSEYVGRTRPWLWEFMAWTAREWNMIQDAWWWNFTAPPTVHAHESRGLMKPSIKTCVWLGNHDCFRDQNQVLWTASDSMLAQNKEDRALRTHPSGLTVRPGRIAEKVATRGGCSPFNCIPVANSDSHGSAGARGHGAGTPHGVCSWWVRYISKRGDVICDPFCGSGTVGAASLALNRHFVGLDLSREYLDLATNRIERPHAPVLRPGKPEAMPLFGELS